MVGPRMEVDQRYVNLCEFRRSLPLEHDFEALMSNISPACHFFRVTMTVPGAAVL